MRESTDERYGAASDFDLTGRVAVVTGGSRGIGAAICERLAAHGAHVVVSSRTQADCEVLAKALRERGHRAEARSAHAGDVEQTQAMLDQVCADHGRLDVLVNNAAANPWFGPLLDLEQEAYDKTTNVNLKGTLFASIAAARLMREAGKGSIVHTGSINAVKPVKGQGIYSVTKGALETMTRAMAKEWARHGIRVNAIAPGITKTDALDELFAHSEELPDSWRVQVPMRRHGMPAEMAGAVAFLASDSASYVTGACLTIDGGLTL